MQVSKFPKAILHEFYQMHNFVPHFAVAATDPVGGEPRFRCQLTCPTVTARHRTFPQTVFTADARTKKAAEHAASNQALAALTASGVVSPTAFPRAQAAAGPPYVNQQEVEHINNRLTVLSVQLEVQDLERRARDPPLLVLPEVAEVDDLPIDVVREKVKAVIAENKRLKLHTDLEEAHRKLVADLILGNPITPP
jgi:hypothetical protein